MPAPRPDSLAAQVRAAIDTALVKVLTADTTATADAHPDVAHALELLTEADNPAGIARDAIEAIHAVDEYLRSGQWDEARCALVTARGRLARPDTAGTPVRHRAPE